MANRYCKVGGSNLLDGTTLVDAWETAIYTFTNVGPSNTAIFSGTSGGIFDIARSTTVTPIPNGTPGNPTIITDNADGVVTFHHPGSGSVGLLWLSGGSPAKQYISFVATSPGNIKFDMRSGIKLRGSLYRWIASGSGTNEYYCELAAGGDPSLTETNDVVINGTTATQGTVGSLAAGAWGFGNTDTLGFNTFYVRLSDGTDPDSKAIGYIKTLHNFGAGIYTGDNTPHHIVFQNIELVHTRGSGVLGGRASDISFLGCLIHDGGHDSASGGPQDHGIYASGPNLIIQGCKIYNMWGWGIHCYSTSASNHTGRVFLNNWVYNNGHGTGAESGDGILIEEGTGDLVANNLVFENGGVGINLWRSHSTSVLHNTIHDNGQYGIRVSTSGVCNGVNVKNNISIGNPLGSIRVESAALLTTIDFNICDAAVSNAAGAQTTITNHVSSAVDTAVWDDPNNGTLASRDYSLKAGSAAIGATTTNECPFVGVTTDLNGDTRTGTFADQGAYAYAVVPPNPPIIGHPAVIIVTATSTLTASSLTLTDGDSNTLTWTVSTPKSSWGFTEDDDVAVSFP